MPEKIGTGRRRWLAILTTLLFLTRRYRPLTGSQLTADLVSIDVLSVSGDLIGVGGVIAIDIFGTPDIRIRSVVILEAGSISSALFTIAGTEDDTFSLQQLGAQGIGFWAHISNITRQTSPRCIEAGHRFDFGSNERVTGRIGATYEFALGIGFAMACGQNKRRRLNSAFYSIQSLSV